MRWYACYWLTHLPETHACADHSWSRLQLTASISVAEHSVLKQKQTLSIPTASNAFAVNRISIFPFPGSSQCVCTRLWMMIPYSLMSKILNYPFKRSANYHYYSLGQSTCHFPLQRGAPVIDIKYDVLPLPLCKDWFGLLPGDADILSWHAASLDIFFAVLLDSSGLFTCPCPASWGIKKKRQIILAVKHFNSLECRINGRIAQQWPDLFHSHLPHYRGAAQARIHLLWVKNRLDHSKRRVFFMWLRFGYGTGMIHGQPASRHGCQLGQAGRHRRGWGGGRYMLQAGANEHTLRPIAPLLLLGGGARCAPGAIGGRGTLLRVGWFTGRTVYGISLFHSVC